MSYRELIISGHNFTIDSEDFERVSAHHWYTLKKGKNNYAVNDSSVRGRKIYLHQFLIGIIEGKVIDHINRDTTDNRKENLRHTTRRVNAYNVTDVRVDNTSGISGVSWDKFRNKWIVRVKVNNNYKFFGRFTTKEEAMRRVDIVNKEYLGKVRRPREFVMGDCHGGYKALVQVMERAEFDYENDTLIQLGDVADGWTETFECVDHLLKVKNLIALRGNHDQTFNQWLKTGSHPYNWDQGALETLKSYCRAVGFDLKYQRTVKRDFQNREVEYYIVNAIPEIIPTSHINFFHKQIKYYMDGSNIFVHAGFDVRAPFRGQDESILYWDRTLWKSAMSAHAGGQKMKLVGTEAEEIFIGHTTTTGWGVDVPLKADIVWNMDTGCGFNGRLSMMEVNTKELYQSDNLLTLYPNNRGRYKKDYKTKVLPW